MHSRLPRIAGSGVLVLAGLFLLLAMPVPDPDPPRAAAGARGFAWNRDTFWQSLEARLAAARESGCAAVDTTAGREATQLAVWIVILGTRSVAPTDPVLDSVETAFFSLEPLVAACPARIPAYVAGQLELRARIKHQSRLWDLSDRIARERLYRLLYGSRAAVEEVVLQQPDAVPALMPGRDEPSATPSAVVHGVRVHSGDLLISRGGAPTSALIARGSDFPGNFSHVALAHVDSAGTVSVIEAHIERGVAVADAERYLSDRKLRIMLLRPRADLAAMVADPMLPHRAATLARERALSGHIPYDFAMDYSDPSKLFCSEVASSVYHELGITLWTSLSTISTAGLRRWLTGFGVTHFVTQEPSDLEYDPQLVVVAEWRDPATLRADHIDNAVIDVMLEHAEAGATLGYPWYMLPVGRVLKGWSWVKERFGGIGPVPEGMSAAAALRNRTFSKRVRALSAEVAALADSVTRAQHYAPPYWELLRLARAVQ